MIHLGVLYIIRFFFGHEECWKAVLAKESEGGFASKMRTTWAGVACPTLLPRVDSLQVPPHVISSSPSDFSHLCALLFTAENKTPSRAPSTEQGADNDDGLGKHAELNNARN